MENLGTTCSFLGLIRDQIKYRKNIIYSLSYFSSDYRRKRTNSWQSPGYSLCFKANDDKLDFDNTDNLTNANDNYSGGLLFLGLCLDKRNRGFVSAKPLSD